MGATRRKSLLRTASPAVAEVSTGATPSSRLSRATVWRMSLPKLPSFLLRSRAWKSSMMEIICSLLMAARRKLSRVRQVKSVWGVDSRDRVFLLMCSTYRA